MSPPGLKTDILHLSREVAKTDHSWTRDGRLRRATTAPLGPREFEVAIADAAATPTPPMPPTCHPIAAEDGRHAATL